MGPQRRPQSHRRGPLIALPQFAKSTKAAYAVVGMKPYLTNPGHKRFIVLTDGRTFPRCHQPSN